MKFTNEMRVGILVIGVIVSLLWLTYRVGEFKFSNKGYMVKVYFKNIDGVDKNAPVRLNGMEVGEVKDVRIIYSPETKMELTLRINEGVKLRQDTKANVRNLGLFGEKFIGLTTGDNTSPFLEPGSSIWGEEPMDFEKLLVKGDKIADNLEGITQNINERLKINSQAIDDSIQNIAAISTNIKERISINKESIDEIIANLKTATQNLEELSADIKQNPWKLLYQPKKRKSTDQATPSAVPVKP